MISVLRPDSSVIAQFGFDGNGHNCVSNGEMFNMASSDIPKYSHGISRKMVSSDSSFFTRYLSSTELGVFSEPHSTNMIIDPRGSSLSLISPISIYQVIRSLKNRSYYGYYIRLYSISGYAYDTFEMRFGLGFNSANQINVTVPPITKPTMITYTRGTAGVSLWRLYINGEHFQEADFESRCAMPMLSNTLSSYPAGIDYLTIHNKCLSQKEIRAIYNQLRCS